MTTPLAPWALTCIVAEPVRPAASRTEAVSVVLPLTVGVHAIVTGPREDVVWLPTTLPAALSVKTFAEPLAPSTHSTTGAVPLTVAPGFGAVIATLREPDGGGGGGATTPLAPWALTCIVAEPVRPAASRTEAVSVVLPLTVGVHAIVTGPREDVVWLPTTLPAALSVKTFAEPLVPSTHSTTGAVPLTVAPGFGAVIATLREPEAAAARPATTRRRSPCRSRRVTAYRRRR